jgi:hypothetical protein
LVECASLFWFPKAIGDSSEIIRYDGAALCLTEATGEIGQCWYYKI